MAVSGLLLAAGHAGAWSVTLDGSRLDVLAAPGEVNDVAITTVGGDILISDLSDPTSVPGSCATDDAGVVTCPTPATLRVDLGDQTDSASVATVVPVAIEGGEGDDQITAWGAGQATISAGDGADVVSSGPAGDDLSGGEGDDQLDAGAGDDHVSGAGGADAASGGPGVDTMEGDGGADVFDGGDDADQLDGGDGADELDGGEGADQVHGDAGDDQLVGGDADDLLSGGPGIDSQDGGDGDDALSDVGGGGVQIGGSGNDILIGSIDADQFDAGPGDDAVTAGDGDDDIDGGDGDDDIDGGNGNDTVFAGAGDDVTHGGAGKDEIDTGSGNADQAFGGDDADVISVVDGGVAGGGPGDDELVAVVGAALRGGDGDDLLLGGPGDDSLSGDDGADDLSGAAGVDTIDGGAGSDVLTPGAGAGETSGGSGDDLLDASGTASSLDGGADRDTVSFEQSGRGVSVSLNGVGDDGVPGQGANVAESNEILVGSGWSDRLALGSPAAVAEGGDGDDVLDGGPGGDVLIGGPGSDTLDGGGGPDTLTGGDGEDVVSYAKRTAPVVVDPETPGADGAAGEADNVAPDLETVIGGAGDDNLAGSATVRNVLIGGGGNDVLRATADDGYPDELRCGQGIDRGDTTPIDLLGADCESWWIDGKLRRGGEGPLPRVSLARRHLTIVDGDVLRIPVHCAVATWGRCRGTVSLRLANSWRKRLIDRMRFSVPAGFEKSIRIRLPRSEILWLRRAHRVAPRYVVTLEAQDDRRNRSSRDVPVKLRMAQRP